DNASTDGSGKRLEQEITNPRVAVFLNEKNLGYAGGNNLGVQLLRSAKVDYFWFLNADTLVEANSLTALVEAAELDEKIAAVGSKILYALPPREALINAAIAGLRGSQARVIWGAGGIVDRASGTIEMRGWHEVDRGQYDDPTECDYVPGCSLLVRRTAIDKVGGMPEEYFMFFEETDWCMRMKEAGYRVCFEPESLVWHRFDDSKMSEPTRTYYYNRARLLFWSRWGSLRVRLRMMWRLLTAELPGTKRALRGASNDEERRIVSAHRFSYLDFIFGQFGRSRRAI
ncbi:MAG: glycosyltransferase family 2 protein, partial [Bdellovibrionales bacterium]|nr:glycosyltransferase family 2 protein [Bdellovibrionales bacterium]